MEKAGGAARRGKRSAGAAEDAHLSSQLLELQLMQRSKRARAADGSSVPGPPASPPGDSFGVQAMSP